ncbi:Crotonobetainyl-CoA:carnitine CoA-transferase CaiB [Arthrobacter alpinus]|uniref:Crotonobetainyl-CoA:carnitine CoA-transferase CaiB n=1 Tax=Arthrobacter alpinus TaxID=656366 RepID=A0A1H5LAG5_9MICC|nr:CoA transferase [Arthrobacter alpinus]SEE73994.1 Crotonobetainyl-CoA:carnitine CoA-transferase CaiB [Arthrobacter alpinus]
MGSRQELPLEGVRILDLSRALAGPYATALLSDLGATIIKAESIKGGDSSRAWPPFENEHSLYFDSANRGKESIAIDFYSQPGRELLWKLAMSADVVVENFRPGVLATMGLDPEELRAAKPELILASVSGFGATGPLSQAPGLDQVAQGMSGLMSVTGPDAEHMYRVGVPMIDMVSGINTALAIAAALVGRARTGAGMEVSTSLLETGLALGAFQSQKYLSTGEVPVPLGNTHPALTPYGVFATADIPVIIAVGNEKQWQQLCVLLGAPELVERPEYATGKIRHANEAVLKGELEALLAGRNAAEWLPLLRSAAIPAGPIYNYEQAFADEQVRSLNMVETVHRADGTELPLVRGPISVNRQAPRIRKAPPQLGEDTKAVLAALSLTQEQIAGLVEAGIVLAAPAPDLATAAREELPA